MEKIKCRLSLKLLTFSNFFKIIEGRRKKEEGRSKKEERRSLDCLSFIAVFTRREVHQ
ncbi:MAG: hypothetical protein F6K48_17435 [Okeania sp. SIO3H1]|nr:hypothetical protein [Okeania sp. SIO3H1]